MKPEPFCVIGVDVGEDWLVRSFTVIHAGAKIGKRLHTGNWAQIQACILGDDVVVGTRAQVEAGAVVGNRVTIHTGALVSNKTVILDDAWVGPGVIVVNTKYPHTATSAMERQSTVIEEGARIGAAAVLLPGIRVGRGALVGAGAVVTKDVPPYSTVVGNPARILK